MRLRIDPWSPEFGAAVEADGEADHGPSVRVDPAVETVDWAEPIRPASPEGGGPLVFIDGVRRVELRVRVEIVGERAWGLLGSYGVGAVSSEHERSSLGLSRIGRVLAVGGGLAPLPVEISIGNAIVTFEPCTAPADDPMTLVTVLQSRMREEEGALAGELAGADPGALILADGPLVYPIAAEGAIVGVVKRMVATYLEGGPAALLPILEPGQRSPLFAIGRTVLDRYAWYQRLIDLRPNWHELAAIVRCEVRSEVGLARARLIANRLAGELPRYASRPGLDPRAPQNLAPVGALEAHLRRLLGDPILIRRALVTHLSTMN